MRTYSDKVAGDFALVMVVVLVQSYSTIAFIHPVGETSTLYSPCH